MQLDIVEQEQIGLLYISGFRSSSKGGGGWGLGGFCLPQPDPKNKGSLEDNFSRPNGPKAG